MKRKLLLTVIIVTSLVLGLTACNIEELFGIGSELNTETMPSISEILSKRADTVSYDILITSSDTETATKSSVWITSDNVRIDTELLQVPITILKDNQENTQYTYSKYLKLAYKSTDDLSEYLYTTWLDTMFINQYTVLGEQSIDGKKCAVISYTIDNEPWTIWIYEQYAFPVLVKNSNTTVKFSNIAFNKTISESLFELPTDITVLDESINTEEISMIIEKAKDILGDLSNNLDISEIKNIIGQIMSGDYSTDITDYISDYTGA